MFNVDNKFTRAMPGIILVSLLLSLSMLLSIEIGQKVQFLRDTILKCTESSKEIFCKYWTSTEVKISMTSVCKHSVNPHFLLGQVWTSCPIFKRENLSGSQFLEGGCWERGGWHFTGRGCSFYIKKLKSKIFNDKKIL